jgi:hypothetical protein
MDLPDPKSPLNEMEKAVFGHNAIRHPITGIPLQMGGYGSEHPAPPPDVQAREHLSMISREHGIEVAREIGRRLDEFEASGGVVEMPAPYVNAEFARRR